MKTKTGQLGKIIEIKNPVEWLEKVQNLTKDFEIKISFKTKNPFTFNFLLVIKGNEGYLILFPDFGILSISQLIGEKLKGFKITEANEKLEKQLLK